MRSFNATELETFVDKSFAALFPKESFTNLVKDFIELVPGDITKFISNLIFLNILDFRFEGPVIKYSTKEKKSLENSFKEIYKNILYIDFLYLLIFFQSFYTLENKKRIKIKNQL